MKSQLHIRPLADLDRDIGEMDFEDPFGLWHLSDSAKSTLRTNPFKRDDSTPAQVLGIVDRQVVGHELVFPVGVNAYDRRFQALAGSTLYVHERYRQSMLGVRLITQQEQLSPDGIALGCGISNVALPVYQLFDFLCFKMPRLMWVFKSRPIVERKLGRSLFSRYVAGVADRLLWAATFGLEMIAGRRTRGMNVTQVDQAGETIERLVQSDAHPLACRHSAAWFNWILNQPLNADPRSRQKLFLVRDSDNRPVGFFMYKVRFHETASHRGYKNLLLGSLIEWQSADQQRLSHATLTLLAVQEMRRDAVDAVEICTDEPEMVATLKRRRFFHVGDLSFVLRVTASSPLRQVENWDRQEHWRLRPAEGDNGLS